MSGQKKKIGEGTFGCVYRPPLKCANGIQIPDMESKVSKILKNDDGENEFKEYETISAVDPGNQYYVGKPEKCLPDELDFRTNVENSGCRVIQTKNPQDYLLLFYKDGGSDLSQFATKGLTEFLAPNKSKQSDLFWLNAHALFKGLQLFNSNDIMHDDLKPQNIVFKYDLKTNAMRFNYIDFGIMEKKSKIEQEIKNGDTTRPFHWSRPLEQGFIKPSNFPENYKNLCKDHGKTDASGKVANLVESYSKFITQSIIKKKKWDSFLLSLKYMKNALADGVTVKDIYIKVTSCVESLLKYKDNLNEFVNKTLKTCDSYSLGFSLNYIANKMYDNDALSTLHYLNLHMFFSKLFDFNLVTRMDDTENMLNEYELTLQRNGILERLGKKFDNHNIVDEIKVIVEIPIPELTAEQEEKIGMTDPGINEAQITKMSLINTVKSVKKIRSKSHSKKNKKSKEINKLKETKETKEKSKQ